MKKICLIICAVLCVFVTACSSAPKVTRVDAGTQVDFSGRWNDSDVRMVCESLIESATSSPRIDAFIRDFSARNRGALPTVIVGRFDNKSSEHIDTDIITRIMRTAIINSGKLEFVEGGNTREALRAERDDQQLNASDRTAASLGNETAANFMLSGVVNSMEEKVDNKTVRAYFVEATLINIETNGILWAGENNDIKKVVRQPKVKL